MKLPLIVGEKLNVTGCAVFAAALRSRDWAAVRRIATEQLQAGAWALDVCLSGCRQNEAEAAREFFLNSGLDAPVFIDSMNIEVMRIALEVYPRVAGLNSANLFHGRELFEATCKLAAHNQVLLVIGCIDEHGIAVTAEQKIRAAERLLQLATRYIPESHILLDLLALPNSPEESILAVKSAAQRFPTISSLLAISNISYGLPPGKRAACERDFFRRAVQCGLGYAIANPLHIVASGGTPLSFASHPLAFRSGSD